MFAFLSAALGLLVIGQVVSWLSRVGAVNYLGVIMVVVVVRELGPLVTALLVRARRHGERRRARHGPCHR